MKKLLLFLLLPLTLFGQSQKISDMTSATSLTGSEYVPIVQTTNKKATVSLLRGFGSYGTAGQLLKVNSGATGFDFFTPPYISSYPGAGIALSTGSAWDTPITNNSSNWNTAFGWGDHATAGYLTALTNGNGTTVNGTGDGVDLGGTLSTSAFLNYTGSSWMLYATATNGDLEGTMNISSSSGGFGNYNTSTGASSSFTFLNDGTNFYSGLLSNSTSANGQSLFVRPTHVSIESQGSDYLGGILRLQSSGSIAAGRYVQIQMPALPASYTLTMPVDDGASGDVLSTDGSGVLSWAAPSGGSGLTVGTSTITSGTNTRILYNNSGVLGEYTVSGSGNVAMTTSPTFTTPVLGTVASGSILTNATGLPPTTGISGWPANAVGSLTNNGSGTLSWSAAGSAWPLTGAASLSGAVTMTTTSTNNVTLLHSGSLGTTQTPALILSNPNAATSGNQQESNAIQYSGYGYKTNSTAASQPVDIYTYNLPVQGAANPYAQFTIDGRINGGTIGNVAKFLFDGTPGNTNMTVGLITITNTNSTASTSFGGNRYIDFTTSSGPSGATWQHNFSSILTGISTAGGIAKWTGTFTRSSGTNAMQFIKVQPTINTTSTYSGTGIALDIDPVLTSVTGFTNLTLRTTSGQTLLNGSTVTANTALDVRGISSGDITRLANSSNTRRFNFSDAGVMTIDAVPATAASISDVILTRDASSGDVEKLVIGSGLTISGGNLVAAQGSIASTGTYYSTTTQGSVTMAASGTGDYAIGIPSYGNKTIVVVETQFMAMKSDGTAAAFSTVTSMFRKDNSGTWTADSAGTSTTSDVTTIVSISGNIQSGVPVLHYVFGAYSGTYAGGFTCKLSSYQY